MKSTQSNLNDEEKVMNNNEKIIKNSYGELLSGCIKNKSSDMNTGDVYPCNDKNTKIVSIKNVYNNLYKTSDSLFFNEENEENKMENCIIRNDGRDMENKFSLYINNAENKDDNNINHNINNNINNNKNNNIYHNINNNIYHNINNNNYHNNIINDSAIINEHTSHGDRSSFLNNKNYNVSNCTNHAHNINLNEEKNEKVYMYRNENKEKIHNSNNKDYIQKSNEKNVSCKMEEETYRNNSYNIDSKNTDVKNNERDMCKTMVNNLSIKENKNYSYNSKKEERNPEHQYNIINEEEHVKLFKNMNLQEIKNVLSKNDASTLKILLCTDNHLGYKENNSIQKKDSFNSFEEILFIAKKLNVDMILNSGDLFHKNKVSEYTLFKSMYIIRKYCHINENDKEIQKDDNINNSVHSNDLNNDDKSIGEGILENEFYNMYNVQVKEIKNYKYEYYKNEHTVNRNNIFDDTNNYMSNKPSVQDKNGNLYKDDKKNTNNVKLLQKNDEMYNSDHPGEYLNYPNGSNKHFYEYGKEDNNDNNDDVNNDVNNDDDNDDDNNDDNNDDDNNNVNNDDDNIVILNMLKKNKGKITNKNKKKRVNNNNIFNSDNDDIHHIRHDDEHHNNYNEHDYYNDDCHFEEEQIKYYNKLKENNNEFFNKLKICPVNEKFKKLIPFYTIHGNHDYPYSYDYISPLDILNISNLINYIGKNNLNNIVVKPILLNKYKSKISIYAVGWMKDERLYRSFENNEVKFILPSDYKNRINILVLHQNRYIRNAYGNNTKNFIKESFIPKFIDLVIWGHEHFSKPYLEESILNSFYNIQLGSSVRTSICPNEYGDKFIGLLEIKNQRFRFLKINLETVRPFEMKDIKLADYELNFKSESVLKEFLHEQTHAILEKIKNNFSDEIKKYFLFKQLFHTKNKLETDSNKEHQNEYNNINNICTKKINVHLNDYQDENLYKSLISISKQDINNFFNNLKNEDFYSSTFIHFAFADHYDTFDLLKIKKDVYEKPLLKIKVEYDDVNIINTQLFGSLFINSIANPSEFLSFYRKKIRHRDIYNNNDNNDNINDNNNNNNNNGKNNMNHDTYNNNRNYNRLHEDEGDKDLHNMEYINEYNKVFDILFDYCDIKNKLLILDENVIMDTIQNFILNTNSSFNFNTNVTSDFTSINSMIDKSFKNKVESIEKQMANMSAENITDAYLTDLLKKINNTS
ncbi:double-strand break repair protein MRE11, putative [Plasmodium reichenowi]|uniref:Double-strand break repair protein MRE11, putative n=1 Tax=Plasmodium reichenowi TaxID=5854 RepID=A0A060RRV6_PLARE|nr:double-strand break repair protein MRE11, putative [Plasmodium reichenowi]